MNEVVSFKAQVNPLRTEIGALASKVFSLKKALVFTNEGLTPEPDKGEMTANIMIAYRHLEDARMRLGKCIQAADGGTSVYDKDANPS